MIGDKLVPSRLPTAHRGAPGPSPADPARPLPGSHCVSSALPAAEPTSTTLKERDSKCGTFSIAAMDPETREWGIAVASRVFDAGYALIWLAPEIGGVATQALINPHLGRWALEEMAKGATPDAALKAALAKDASPEDRQVGIVDRNGTAAAHTGSKTLEWAGHRTAESVTVQGNILVGQEVVDDMLGAFLESSGPLSERLLVALEAAGGDKRGKQSAALVVVRKNGGYDGANDRLVELRIPDHPEPVVELRRLYEMWKYSLLVPAYARLADDEPDGSGALLHRVHSLLQSALTDELDKAEVYNSLAWHLALRKKYPQETLKAAQRARDLDPGDPNILDTLAEAYFAAGDNQQAIHWEREALRRAPDNPFFHKQLARFTALDS